MNKKSSKSINLQLDKAVYNKFQNYMSKRRLFKQSQNEKINTSNSDQKPLFKETEEDQKVNGQQENNIMDQQ